MNAATLIEIKELCSRCHVHILDGDWDRAQELVDELYRLDLAYADTQEMMEWIRRVAIELHLN